MRINNYIIKQSSTGYLIFTHVMSLVNTWQPGAAHSNRTSRVRHLQDGRKYRHHIQ